MIICHSHKFIYVHPPKTAGTAVSVSLGELCGPDDAQIGDWPGAQYAKSGRLKGIGKHATLSALQFPRLSVDLRDYCVVLSVRNPWDRLVSFYHWARVQEFDSPQIIAAQTNDFDGFLSSTVIQSAFYSSPYRKYAANPDLVLRSETLGDDLRQLGQRLSVAIRIPARVNMSERQQDWRPYYSDETAALVAKMCAKDIADYGYSFEGVVL